MVKLPSNTYILKMTSGERIKIPREACDTLNIGPGDYLFLQVNEKSEMKIISPSERFLDEITREFQFKNDTTI